MPLVTDTIHIDIRGLSQHDDPRKRIPGQLERCDNLEVAKAGALTIRRGYRRIHTARVVGDFAVRTAGDQLFHRVAAWRGGVVVLAHAKVFAVVSRLSEVAVTSGTTGIADHGRLGRSGVRSRIIDSGELSTGAGGTAAGPGSS